jgi:hypothetical protein
LTPQRSIEIGQAPPITFALNGVIALVPPLEPRLKRYKARLPKIVSAIAPEVIVEAWRKRTGLSRAKTGSRFFRNML